MIKLVWLPWNSAHPKVDLGTWATKDECLQSIMNAVKEKKIHVGGLIEYLNLKTAQQGVSTIDYQAAVKAIDKINKSN